MSLIKIFVRGSFIISIMTSNFNLNRFPCLLPVQSICPFLENANLFLTDDSVSLTPYNTKVNYTSILESIERLINNYYSIYCLQIIVFSYYPLYLLTKLNRRLFLLGLISQIIRNYKTNLFHGMITDHQLLLSQVTNFPQYNLYYLFQK